MKKYPTLLILSIILFLLISCASTKNITISIKKLKPLKSTKTNYLVAGISKVDITPPPGLPMAGHSLNGHSSVGVRTKIYARVLYLRSKKGNSVALIQCDLLSGSRLLHHKVAELIAKKTDVPIEGLVLAATHTHAGPGNIFGSIFYNRFASNKEGFNEKYFNFLSTRISKAVIDAYKSQRKAKIATGMTKIWDVTRNRSLPAYHMNKNLKGKKPSIYEAVNPDLHMIRVDCLDDDGKFKPIAAFSNFSIHPNLGNKDTDKLIHGDNFAYIEREVEWGIKKKYNLKWEPIHAATNLNHGDNTPNYRKDVKLGFVECKRVGVIIGKRALKLFNSLGNRLKSNIEINYRAKEFDMQSDNFIDEVTLCNPKIGQSVLPGAPNRGRNTPLMGCIYGFMPGTPKKHFTKGCHKEKWILLGDLQSLLAPIDQFPKKLFIQAVQIDETMFIPFPFETTVEIGNRIRHYAKTSAAKHKIKNIKKFVVLSTCNGYCGYVTTREEYSMQYYEGGSNFYGPNTGKFLCKHTEKLVGELKTKGQGGDLPDKFQFPLEVKNYYPKVKKPGGKRKVFSKAKLYKANPGKMHKESYWRFLWVDLPPILIELHKPLVKIETSSNGKKWEPLVVDHVPVDDRGYDIAIICKKKTYKKNMALYEARWYNPLSEEGKMYRFVILGRTGQKIFYSPGFK